MKPPHEPNSDGTRRAPKWSKAGAAVVCAGGSLLYWLPVLVALVLLAQVALRGLRPALAEQRRLAVCEARLEERAARNRARRAELEALHQALADPIYVERLRLERRGE